jgi:hypothetical protein
MYVVSPKSTQRTRPRNHPLAGAALAVFRGSVSAVSQDGVPVACHALPDSPNGLPRRLSCGPLDNIVDLTGTGPDWTGAADRR